MKQKHKAVKVLATITAAAVSLSTVLLSACSKKDNFYTIPETTLPTAEQFALNKYNYEDLSDVQTTVRADSRNVLERNLPRAQIETLSDDFSIVYNTETKAFSAEYGTLVATTDTVKTATIHFDKYPSPSASCEGPGAFSNGTMNGKNIDSYAESFRDYYLNNAEIEEKDREKKYEEFQRQFNKDFYKYMLMTQGQHLAAEAAHRSANGTLTQEWLKKHPAADAQYGAVLGENNAVKKEITLDPIYRSYHAMGLYLPAGELVTVKVEGLKKGERLSVVLGVQDSLAWAGGADDATYQSIVGKGNNANGISSHSFFTKADVIVANGKMVVENETDKKPVSKVTNQSQWNRQNGRLPWLHASFTFTENKEYKIGNPFGGALQIGMENCYSRAKVTFTGAVETPHYVLGQTTPEYFDEYLRDAPGVIAILDTENGQLIGPTGEMGTHSYMRQVKTDEIDKLAMLWHSFLSVNESFTGGTYNRFNKIMFDWHVPAGAAVALGNYSFAQPTGWFNDAMNYRRLLEAGTWGTLHEIGHNHASSYGTVWGFGCGMEGEVRNNALILLSYIMMCDIGTTVRNSYTPEHGQYANPYNVLNETLSKKGKYADTENCGYFEILGMYANIMHSFGAEKYYELLYTYKDNPSYCSNKRADFAFRCSLVYGMNFVKYFNEFYSAKISDDMFSAEQLASMQPLPNYEPVSCFYAGGIDGVKTAGDYIVTFGDDITFDLYGKTVSSLDTKEQKGFEILRVGKPEHGKIKKTDDGKWTYSFNKNYTGTFDQFTFDVKLADGVVHTLAITLRIAYNGGRVTVYNDVELPNKNWEEVHAKISERNPDAVLGSSNGTIGNYQTASGKKDVRISEFYWQAPKSGVVSLSAKWDDWAELYFGEDFDNLEKLNLKKDANNPSDTNDFHDIKTYGDYGNVKTVQEGKFYAVKIVNVNTGGGGSASFAYKYEGEENYAVPETACVFHPNFPLGKEVNSYVYEPQFLVSKKDNIKITLTGTDKSEWSMVKAPENIVGGRFVTEQQVDPETGKPIEGSVITIDKWTYLIDGLDNTNMHTTYGGADKKITPENPHEFIVDTASIQNFNYFSVVTRNNVNSYITDFELQIADTLDGEWKTIATGDRSNYSGTKITLKFPSVSGRYLKLIVKGTTGGNFSVLAELDGGIQSTTQQVISPTSSKLFATKGWQNSADIADEPNGFLISEKKNSKLVLKFKGESIALYGATGKGYGSVKIIIDGEKIQTVNLNSETEETRKLIFNQENLSNKEHTVEIITTSADKVMLSVFGIPYSANLINAPDIYKEKVLTVSLIVFVLLFVAVAAVLAVLFFVPKFRNKIFGSRFMKKQEENANKPKAKKPAKAEKASNAATKPTEKTAEKAGEKQSSQKPVKLEAKPAPKTAEPKKATPVKLEPKKTAEKKPTAKPKK